MRWTAAGHRVTIVTSFPNWPDGQLHAGYRNAWRQVEVTEGIRVVRVWTFITGNEGFGLLSLDYLSYMATAILAALHEPRPDVVVGTSPQFFAAVAAWITGLLRGRPFVFELRDLWPASILPADVGIPGPLYRVLEGLELLIYRRARAVVAVTESFRDDLVRRGIPAGKIHVVRNGVDPNRYSRRLPLMQWPPHGADRRAPRRPRHPARTRAAVGHLRPETPPLLPRRPPRDRHGPHRDLPPRDRATAP